MDRCHGQLGTRNRLFSRNKLVIHKQQWWNGIPAVDKRHNLWLSHLSNFRSEISRSLCSWTYERPPKRAEDVFIRVSVAKRHVRVAFVPNMAILLHPSASLLVQERNGCRGAKSRSLPRFECAAIHSLNLSRRCGSILQFDWSKKLRHSPWPHSRHVT